MTRSLRLAVTVLALATACSSSQPRSTSSPSPTSSPTVSPAASPSVAPSATTAVVSEFVVVDVSFVSRDHGFALGTARCSGTACVVLLESTDGARQWHLVSRVPATTDDPACTKGACVRHLRFVTPRVGYAFDPSLLMTVDGGRTWKAQRGPAVHSLEGDSVSVLRVSTADPGCAGAPARLESSAPGSSTWSLVHTLTSDDLCPPALYRQGHDRVALVSYGNPAGGAPATATLYTSSDRGTHLTRRDDPCVPAGGGDGYTSTVALAPAGTVAALCATQSSPTKNSVRISTDGGMTFGTARGIPTDISSRGDRGVSAFTAASAHRLLVVAGPGGGPGETFVFASQDGGATWTNADGFGSGAVQLVGFQDGLTARAAQGDEIHTTSDGGRTWRTDTFLPE